MVRNRGWFFVFVSRFFTPYSTARVYWGLREEFLKITFLTFLTASFWILKFLLVEKRDVGFWFCRFFFTSYPTAKGILVAARRFKKKKTFLTFLTFLTTSFWIFVVGREKGNFCCLKQTSN